MTSVVKYLSSSVSIGSFINVHFRFCSSVSISSLFLCIWFSSLHSIVSLRASVCDLLFFVKMTLFVCYLFFSAADLYNIFHVFVDGGMLQYCFHDCIFAFFISPWY